MHLQWDCSVISLICTLYLIFLVQLLSSTPSLVVIPVLLDVLKRFVEKDTIVIQVLITLASYGRIGEVSNN